MRKIFTFTTVILISFMAFSSQQSKNVAIVKLMRGKAEMLSPTGEKAKIKKGMWLKEGTIIKTKEKSFVKLSFIDKSSMNIGPKSELKIEKFSKSEAGVINVLTGKIRSQVTKDYLNMDKDKSKLFVKSRNAVMGVRGTDFLFSANKRTGATTTVLFEGAIVFNKLNKGDNIRDLESIVNKGRSIKPGEVSVALRSKNKPTVPAKMNSKQFAKLNKNQNLTVGENKPQKKMKSVVPPGLSGAIVAGDNSNLKEEIKKIVKVNIPTKPEDDKKVDVEASKGFVNGDDVKPADGIMVHVDTGTLIPPGIDSKFDQNSGEWVSSTIGSASDTGEYVPPQGFQINDDGQLLKVDVETGLAKEVVVIDIKPVDQMPPLEQAPTVEYKAPTENPEIKGPAPAGNLDEIQQEFEKGLDEIIKEDEVINNQVKQEYFGTEPPPVVGSTDDPNYLPPPPPPGDCSTCNQPNTLFNNTTNAPPPPKGKTRLKLKVRKNGGNTTNN